MRSFRILPGVDNGRINNTGQILLGRSHSTCCPRVAFLFGASMARKPKAEEVAERTDICKNCRFCAFTKSDGMRCRRYPPSFAYDYQSGASSAQWPETSSDSWCGEFAPQLSS